MSIELSVLVAIITVIIAWMGFKLSKQKYQLDVQNQLEDKQKTIKTEATENARVAAKLDYISQGVDTIRIDLKSNEQRINHVSERVTRVEESTKQAHKRINELEEDKKIENKLENKI